MAEELPEELPEETHEEVVERRNSLALTFVNALRRPLILLGILLGLMVTGVVLINSPLGHRWIAERIAAYAPASGLKVSVGRIQGSIFGELVLRDMHLSDPKGEFAFVPETELDWRPLNWFVKGLDVRKLVLKRGTLNRFPELNPGDPNAPLLPDFDIRIDRFEIDRLKLAEGIIGEERTVNFKAHVDIASGRAIIAAKGELGGTDKLAFKLDSRPDDDVFDIALNYSAPKGGVLAGMAGAKDDLHAVISGDGSWTKWDGTFFVRQGEEHRLALFGLSNRSGTYRALGQVRPNGYLSGAAKQALGEVVSLDIKGNLKDSVADGETILVGRAIQARGKGVVDLAQNAFEDFLVRARLSAPVELSPGTQIAGGRLSATLDGKFRDLSIGHDLRIDRFRSGQIVATGLTQQGNLRRIGNDWELPLNLRLKRLASGVAMIDPRLVNGTARGVIRLSGSRLTSDGLRIGFPGMSANVSVNGDTQRGTYALAGPVTVSGLALKNVGTVSGTAKVAANFGANRPWALSADVSGTMPKVENGTIETVAGTGIAFRGKVLLGADRPILFRNTTLKASKLQLALDGRYRAGRAVLQGQGRHTEYGAFTVDAEVAGNGPKAELHFENPIPAAGLRDVRLAIAPIDEGFGIETEGQSTLGPFDGDLRFYSLPDEPSRIAVDRFRVFETDVNGELALVDGGVDGTLTLAGGGLDGSLSLAPQGAGQGFNASFKARDASFGGETPLSIARGDLTADGVIATGATSIDGTLQAQGIRYGRIFLGKLDGAAKLSNGRGEFQANMTGRRGSRFELQVQGDVTPARAAIVARGQYSGRRIAMPRRAILARSDQGGWMLRPTQISYGNGAMIAQGRFGGSAPTTAFLQMNKMPLILADLAFGEIGLGGDISGIIRYGADEHLHPVGEAKVMVDGLTRSGLTLTSRPIDLALVARLSEADLQARAVVKEDGNQRGRIQARISELPEEGSLTDRLSLGRLFAQLRYDGPADALWRLSRVETFDMTGNLALAANATGTLANPRIRGSLAGKDMQLSSALTGTDIREVAVQGRFTGAQLVLETVSGKATNGGMVTGSGAVDLSGLGQGLPIADIRLSAKNARILNRSDMAATVTGPLRIVTNRRRGTIAGKLVINEARWRLGNASAVEQLPNIRTREINLPPDIAPADVVSQPWRYLIDARAADGVDVSGLGLESEWRAQVRLRGTTSDPRIGGEANLVEGDYRFAGTEFELVRGRIVFSEDEPPDPQLDILAETTVEDLTARVTVTGTALQPEIALSSVPALPEEEILARLLYGGSISTLSATDAIQLGAALASLRGGGGLDPINQLRDAIGLDRLRIVAPDTALDRGTAIAMGKNFTRQIYGEIITDGQGYSATQLEFRVTGWLSLLASVSTVGRQSVGVEYRRDY